MDEDEEDPKIPWLRGEEAQDSAVETVTLVRGRGVAHRSLDPSFFHFLTRYLLFFFKIDYSC